MYAARFGLQDFIVGDVRQVVAWDLPAELDLVTAPFPCIDLSLAGNRAGLAGRRRACVPVPCAVSKRRTETCRSSKCHSPNPYTNDQQQRFRKNISASWMKENAVPLLCVVNGEAVDDWPAEEQPLTG